MFFRYKVLIVYPTQFNEYPSTFNAMRYSFGISIKKNIGKYIKKLLRMPGYILKRGAD